MKKLRFYPKSHTYYFGKNKLSSVTTLLKDYFQLFDSKGLAKKIAGGFKYRNKNKKTAGVTVTDLEKTKATQRYWLNEWKEAAEHGTRVHSFLEKYILDRYHFDTILGLPEERDVLKSEQGTIYYKSLDKNNYFQIRNII